MSSFEFVQGGPPNPASSPTYGPSFWADTKNNALYFNASQGAAWQRIVPGLLSQSLIVGTPTATAVAVAPAIVMPAGLVNTKGKSWMVYGSGQYVIGGGGGTPTMSLALLMGAVTIGTLLSAATTQGATNNMNFQFVVTTQTTGTAGTDYVSGALDIVLGTTSTVVAATKYIISGVAASTAWDHTLASNVTLVPTFAGTGNTFQLTQAYLELLN